MKVSFIKVNDQDNISLKIFISLSQTLNIYSNQICKLPANIYLFQVTIETLEKAMKYIKI